MWNQFHQQHDRYKDRQYTLTQSSKKSADFLCVSWLWALSWKYWTVRKVSSQSRQLRLGISFIKYCTEVIQHRSTGLWVTGTGRNNYCLVLIYLFRAATKLGHSHSSMTVFLQLHQEVRRHSDRGQSTWPFCSDRLFVNNVPMCKYQYQSSLSHSLSLSLSLSLGPNKTIDKAIITFITFNS